jgi:hypothetical protein
MHIEPSSDSFLLINQMAKKTRKLRKSRRRTRRRIPRRHRGGALPLVPSEAIAVSDGGSNTDNELGMKKSGV